MTCSEHIYHMTALLFSHKNCMITCVITLWLVAVTSLTTCVLAMLFLLEILSILKAIKSDFNGSYDKQNLTQMVISYEIMKLAEGSFHIFHMK